MKKIYLLLTLCAFLASFQAHGQLDTVFYYNFEEPTWNSIRELIDKINLLIGATIPGGSGVPAGSRRDRRLGDRRDRPGAKPAGPPDGIQRFGVGRT